MAVKMMTPGYTSSIDQQYFNDNMLTDEDFHFDTENFLEVTLEEQNILQSFANKLPKNFPLEKMLIVPSDTNGESEVINYVSDLDLDDLLKECMDEAQIPTSPNSTDILSPESDISVISIPEDDSNCEVNCVISDTPPQTPPGLLENSKPNPQFNPIVLSLNNMPTLAYVVPPSQKQSKQPITTPVKMCMNIQPKPENSNGQDTTSALKLNHNTDNTSVDPDQLVKLPNGIFQVKSPVSQPSRPGRPPKNTSVSKATKNGKVAMTRCDLIEVCSAAVKRQERIIKNRESAYQSRKRKKEYVQKIEDELNQIASENTSLREENCRLRLKISALEKEIIALKTTFTPKAMKKTICLMVVLFMLTFNFSSYGNIFEKIESKPLKADVENHRIGRVLLWNEINNTTKERNTSKVGLHNRFMKSEEDSTFVVSWDHSDNSSTCQHFINKSESLRLENDLLGWVKRVEKKQKQKESKLKKGANMKASIPPLPKLQQLGARFRSETHKDVWAKRKNPNEILIYQTPRKDYEDFFDAIHRRDDSFYFISFSGDHLLLPAIAHNQTLRPRMSFVMPAMILNDSVGDSDDHISMMQIDCEVMDTKLVYIKESVIPVHLRQKHNSSSKSNSKSDSKYAINRNPSRLHESTMKLPQQPSGND